jgi:hypothetical protein
MSNGARLSQPGDRSPIRHDTVLVVEGRDAFGSFLGLLEELGLQDRVEIQNAGGINDWPNYFRVLPAISGFDAVTSLGVVRDSERDPVRAFQEVCRDLRGGGLAVPTGVLQPTPTPPFPRVTVMLLPDGQTAGMLETLCWQALTGDPRLSCIDDFLKCVETQTGQPVARLEKSPIYAYIAAREEPWLFLGLAARSQYFPWSSPAFHAVKQFVQGLAGGMP